MILIYPQCSSNYNWASKYISWNNMKTCKLQQTNTVEANIYNRQLRLKVVFLPLIFLSDHYWPEFHFLQLIRYDRQRIAIIHADVIVSISCRCSLDRTKTGFISGVANQSSLIIPL